MSEVINPKLIKDLRGLVVSCQAYPGEPMRHPETIAQLAESAVLGGARGVRIQGIADISFVAGRCEVPIIGLWKHGQDGVFITPTLRHARAVRDAGADIVALDGTRRSRPDGLTLAETVRGLKSDGEVLVMADCGSLPDALAAAESGADLIGTTLAGYTDERPALDGPDLELITEIREALPDLPLVAEGRVHTPAQAAAVLAAGADTVVVGTAITHPISITRWFVDATAG